MTMITDDLLLNQKWPQEREFLQIVIKYLEGFSRKELAFQRIIDNHVKGISDILVCYHGVLVLLELKRDTGKPTVHQLRYIEKMEMAGGVGAVCWTLQDVVNTLERGKRVSDGYRKED